MEKKLEIRSKMEGIPKSKVVKRALDQYLKTTEDTTNPYELGKDLFGKFSSNEGNLSIVYKKRVDRKIAEKHTH